MKKIFASVLIITFFACKKEQQTTRVEATQTQEEYLEKNKLNIPKKEQFSGLNTAQKDLVQDWIEFNAVMENIKLINSSSRFAIVEDLKQLADNIDVIDEKRFPKGLDVMQIRSRFLVLKTKALKLQDDATDDSIPNAFIEKEIIEMNKVFKAVCYQIEQTSLLNMEPDEILGDIFKLKDSTELDSMFPIKSELPKRELKEVKKKKLLKEPFKEVKSENN
jgi:hypothetical protein